MVTASVRGSGAAVGPSNLELPPRTCAMFPTPSSRYPPDWTWKRAEEPGPRPGFRIPPEGDPWLLKIPRPNTGEHWAEKIAAEIGGMIRVECAHVELARYGEQAALVGLRLSQDGQERPPQTQSKLLGTICRSFLPDAQETAAEYYFFHGWEVLQHVVDGYDTALRFRQRDHNVKNIGAALAELMGVHSMNPMPQWDYAMENLASYALLDGVIGNTDRHHENWMIAWVLDHGDKLIEIMPSFDHASSLGRELTDDRRRQIPGIGWRIALCTTRTWRRLRKRPASARPLPAAARPFALSMEACLYSKNPRPSP